MLRFNCSFTLWLEKNAQYFSLPIAITLCVIVDAFNSFNGGLYYFINIASFVIGFIVGIVIWLNTIEWMRDRSLWGGEWENKYGKTKIPIRYDRSKREASSGNLNNKNQIYENRIDNEYENQGQVFPKKPRKNQGQVFP